MEPADMPLKSSSPPPLNGVGHGEVGSEEELRDLGQLSLGLSCRPPALADSPDSPSSLKQPFPPAKSATHQPGCNFNLPVKQSQPTFSMNSGSAWMDMEHQALKADSFVRLTNDYHRADTCIASAANTRRPGEELGFADFTVFTEQSVHQWCCGFTPSGNPENLDSRLGQRSSSNSPVERTSNPGQGGLWDSELSPPCLYKAREKDCTVIRRWQEGDTAAVRPSQDQDQQQPQETARPLVFPSMKPYVEDGVSEQNDLTCRESSFKTSEVQGDEGVQSDEEEEPGNYHDVSSSTVACAQSKGGEDLHHFISTATQEISSTSVQPRSGTHSKDDVSESDRSSESQRDPAPDPTADAAVLILGTLPPSDSFADFCAAPMQNDGEDLWAEFSDLKEQGGEQPWSRAPAGQDEDKAEQSGVTGRSSSQLFLDSFLGAEGPSAALEEEVRSLAALLDVQQPPQKEEEEEEEERHSQWIQKGLWWLHQDLHSTVGLGFQWRGSHSSRTLLRCLGVDAKNTCLLDTTKDAASAACSPRRAAPTAPAPPALQNTPAPSTASIQETIPSSQLDWNNRGLSSSQDGTCLRRAPHFWGRK